LVAAQATHTLRLARIWRAAFTAGGLDPKRVVVAASYENPAWIPYFFNTFGADAAKVDVIATVGSYGEAQLGRKSLLSFAGS